MEILKINPILIRIAAILGFVFILSNTTYTQNAPHTIAPVLFADSGNIVNVPIRVSNFNNIGAVSLTLNFDNSVLVYQSASANSGFPGLSFGNAIPGTVTIAGFTFSDTGITLPDSTVLFTLLFTCSGGTSGLIWFDNGSSCEYAGSSPLFSALNDSPQSLYYQNGSVSGFPLPGGAGTIEGPLDGIVCAGQAGVEYSVAPIADATGYIWTLPEGASITNGNNTNEITVSFSTGATDGSISVYGTNAYGSGISSPSYPVSVSSPPSILTQPVSPGAVYAGSGTAIFNVTSSGAGLTYQWQEFSSDWNNLDDADYYSGVFSDSLVVTNPPLSFNGYHYRCIVNGLCDPQVITDGNAMLSVSAFPLPAAAGFIAGPDGGMVCAGETGVIFSVFPIPDATGYVWTLPSGASITGGSNTNEITVSFSATAINGNVTVYGTNAYGFGPLSPYYPLIINSPPIIIGQPVSPEPVYADSGIVFFTVSAYGSGLSYQWQEFQSGWINISDSACYSGSQTDSLVILNPSIEFNGNQYRCIIYGECDPQAITDGNAVLTVNIVLQSNQHQDVENKKIFFSAYPNPCTVQSTFRYSVAEDCTLMIDFVTGSGVIAQSSSSFAGQKGMNETTLETDQLKPGIYLVRLKTNSGEYLKNSTLKLLIQH